VISYHDFLVFFTARWLLLYTSCVHEVPYAFNNILITYQKKEKQVQIIKQKYKRPNFSNITQFNKP